MVLSDELMVPVADELSAELVRVMEIAVEDEFEASVTLAVLLPVALGELTLEVPVMVELPVIATERLRAVALVFESLLPVGNGARRDDRRSPLAEAVSVAEEESEVVFASVPVGEVNEAESVPLAVVEAFVSDPVVVAKAVDAVPLAVALASVPVAVAESADEVKRPPSPPRRPLSDEVVAVEELRLSVAVMFASDNAVVEAFESLVVVASAVVSVPVAVMLASVPVAVADSLDEPMVRIPRRPPSVDVAEALSLPVVVAFESERAVAVDGASVAEAFEPDTVAVAESVVVPSPSRALIKSVAEAEVVAGAVEDAMMLRREESPKSVTVADELPSVALAVDAAASVDEVSEPPRRAPTRPDAELEVEAAAAAPVPLATAPDDPDTATES